jgi:hypothetical protein
LVIALAIVAHGATSGIPLAPRALVSLLLSLYAVLCSGPLGLMLAYPSSRVTGACFLVVAVGFAAFSFFLSRRCPRFVFLSLSAVAWFAASLFLILSEAV